ncbi:MAG: hypothetical protein ACP5NV_06030 [Candidatus Woesearchaeota archaeon]
MHKKGSMELSVNSIVILVIAVVMMGLILGFIRAKFADISGDLAKSEPEAPTADINNQITISRDPVVTGAGKSLALKMSAYNGEIVTMTNATPHITCNVNNIISTQTYTGKTIAVGGTESYIALLKVGNAAKDTYLCQISVKYKDAGNDKFSTYKKEFTLQLQ